MPEEGVALDDEGEHFLWVLDVPSVVLRFNFEGKKGSCIIVNIVSVHFAKIAKIVFADEVRSCRSHGINIEIIAHKIVSIETPFTCETGVEFRSNWTPAENANVVRQMVVQHGYVVDFWSVLV